MSKSQVKSQVSYPKSQVKSQVAKLSTRVLQLCWILIQHNFIHTIYTVYIQLIIYREQVEFRRCYLKCNQSIIPLHNNSRPQLFVYTSARFSLSSVYSLPIVSVLIMLYEILKFTFIIYDDTDDLQMSYNLYRVDSQTRSIRYILTINFFLANSVFF